MSMRIVTPKTNFIDNGDGSFDLHNEALTAVVVQSHTAVRQTDSEIGIQLVLLHEITWEGFSSPAGQLVDPADYVCIGFSDEIDDDEDGDDGLERDDEVEVIDSKPARHLAAASGSGSSSEEIRTPRIASFDPGA